VTTAPVAVVTLPAEIDMATAGAIGERVAAALAPGVRAVIADMTGTTIQGVDAVLPIYHSLEEALAGAE
jgi:anti-anti-sigma regulatory factor